MAATKSLFEQALSAEGVTGKQAAVARSIYKQESGSGSNTTTSNAGAVGGMQIIPGTFAEVADKGWDIKDPLHNARAGIRYVMKMFEKAGGDPALTAAGYYGGPGGLEKARKGIAVSDPRNPDAPTTLEYGQQVASRVGGSKASPKAVAPVVPAPTIREMPDLAPRQALMQMPPISGQLQSELVQVPTSVATLSPPQPAASNPYPQTDPWAEWNLAMRQRQPVQAADLNYGNQPPEMSLQAKLAAIPDYQAMVGYANQNLAPDFRAFGPMRARAG